MTMKRYFSKLNRRGSSLIMVIICMLFVSVIVSMVLTMTVSSVNNVAIRRETTDTFYSSEEILDELRTRLSEYCDQAMRITYTKWLQTYTNPAEGDSESNYMRIFREELRKILIHELLADGLRTSVDAESLLYTSLGDSTIEIPGTVDTSKADPYEDIIAIEDGKLVLKNVKVSFTDSNNKNTFINTDLVFNAKYPGFQSTSEYGDDLESLYYCIITDSTVDIQSNTGGGAKGNIYSGQGFNIRRPDTDVSLHSKTIVSGGPFNILDGASVSVFGEEDDSAYGKLWTKNIRLYTGARFAPATANTTPSMTAHTELYVQDDLTLDSTNASFKMSGSDSCYYGFSTKDNTERLFDDFDTSLPLWTGTADGSSAIIINGSNATLDMQDAKKVWVAGKSFVSVPSIFGSDSGALTQSGDNTFSKEYIEGESISYRGQQACYLIPGDCIMGIGHNPMTEEEYQRISSEEERYQQAVANGTEQFFDRVYYIDMKVSPTIGDLTMDNYIVHDEPYRVARVKYLSSDSEDMYYLYLNFQTADRAAAFYVDYAKLMRELIASRMSGFTGKILVDQAKLVTTGNVLDFDPTRGTTMEQKLNILERNRNFNAIDIIDMEFELDAKYKGLLGAMDEGYYGYGNEGRMALSLVHWDEVDRVTDAIVDLTTVGSTEYKLYTGTDTDGGGSDTKDNNDVIISSNAAGVILARGNVTIQAGATFTGTIIALGTVTIEGNGTYVSSAHDDVNGMVQSHTALTGIHSDYLGTNGEVLTLYDLFIPTITGTRVGMTGSGEVSKLVSIDYRNWEKNEKDRNQTTP